MEQFENRFDAGRKLSAALEHLKGGKTLVLGLARGGVEVASTVAEELGAELDVLIARKVGAPKHPEYGIGAVAPGSISVYDQKAVRRLGISTKELAEITRREVEEVERRLEVYRGNRSLELRGRCAILVDDGLATGITALAACRYARTLGPERLVFAVPVASQPGADLIRPEVDEFVALEIPPLFYAVGAWYSDFSQTTDEEVLNLLGQATDRERKA